MEHWFLYNCLTTVKVRVVQAIKSIKCSVIKYGIMVFDFLSSGKNKDLIHALKDACHHLQGFLTHVDKEHNEAAFALSVPDALGLHADHDARDLWVANNELEVLIHRYSSSKKAMDEVDVLDSSKIISQLTRARSCIQAALFKYPELVNIQSNMGLDGIYISPFVESIHKNLSGALECLEDLEVTGASLLKKKEAVGATGKTIEDGVDRPTPTVSMSGKSPYILECSSYFLKQMHHREIPLHDLQTALKKVVNFVSWGQTPSIPGHGEPHCYGQAPNHLNGVVVGSQERLIYFLDNSTAGSAVRLCCWISGKVHHDAFTHLRHQNVYRRIMSKDPSIKVTRQDFSGFQLVDEKELKGGIV